MECAGRIQHTAGVGVGDGGGGGGECYGSLLPAAATISVRHMYLCLVTYRAAAVYVYTIVPAAAVPAAGAAAVQVGTTTL
jgi:hypothetical protein